MFCIFVFNDRNYNPTLYNDKTYPGNSYKYIQQYIQSTLHNGLDVNKHYVSQILFLFMLCAT